MTFTENFDIYQFLNLDMFEDDDPEKEADTTEDSQTVSSIHMAVPLPAPMFMCSLARA